MIYDPNYVRKYIYTRTQTRVYTSNQFNKVPIQHNQPQLDMIHDILMYNNTTGIIIIAICFICPGLATGPGARFLKGLIL